MELRKQSSVSQGSVNPNIRHFKGRRSSQSSSFHSDECKVDALGGNAKPTMKRRESVKFNDDVFFGCSEPPALNRKNSPTKSNLIKRRSILKKNSFKQVSFVNVTAQHPLVINTKQSVSEVSIEAIQAELEKRLSRKLYQHEIE